MANIFRSSKNFASGVGTKVKEVWNNDTLGNIFVNITNHLLKDILKFDKKYNNVNKDKNGGKKDKQGKGTDVLLQKKMGKFKIKAAESDEGEVKDISVTVVYKEYFNKNSDISKTLKAWCHEIYKMQPDKITRKIAKLLAVCNELLTNAKIQAEISINNEGNEKNKNNIKEIQKKLTEMKKYYNKLKIKEGKFYTEYKKEVQVYSKGAKENKVEINNFEIDDVGGDALEWEKEFLSIKKFYNKNYKSINDSASSKFAEKSYETIMKEGNRWIKEYENKFEAMSSIGKKGLEDCKKAEIFMHENKQYSYTELVGLIKENEKKLEGLKNQIKGKEEELKKLVNENKLKDFKSKLLEDKESNNDAKKQKCKDKLEELKKDIKELNELSVKFAKARETTEGCINSLKNARSSKAYKKFKKEAVGMHSIKYNSNLKKKREEAASEGNKKDQPNDVKKEESQK